MNRLSIWELDRPVSRPARWIDPDAWATLDSEVSHPLWARAGDGSAVKVINHLGDEVMKVFHVG
jgi:hypothetical protein